MYYWKKQKYTKKAFKYLNCSPTKKLSFSCYSPANLLKLKREWNKDHPDKKIHTNTRIGIEHTNVLIGEKQIYSIEGTKTSFKGDNSNTYLDLLIGTDYFITPEAKLFASGNYMISSSDMVGLSGNIGFEANF